eukprot:13532712-Ditylum_brightwellii.AAC.2
MLSLPLLVQMLDLFSVTLLDPTPHAQMMKSLAWPIDFPGYMGYVSMWKELKDFVDNRAMGISTKRISLPDSKIVSLSHGTGRKVADPLKVTVAVSAR